MAVMNALPASLSLAFGQLSDPAILRVIGKSVAITLAAIIALGLIMWRGITALLARWDFALREEFGAAIAVLLTIVGSWLLFRIIALVVLQFFADEIVAAVEAKHYPSHAASVRKVPVREELGHALRSALRALGINLLALPFALMLLITGIGTAVLFWAVNAWLLGRELQDMVWLRHRLDPSHNPPLSGAQRFALGGAVAAIMFVPFLNLLAPVIGAASATHMVHREGKLVR